MASGIRVVTSLASTVCGLGAVVGKGLNLGRNPPGKGMGSGGFSAIQGCRGAESTIGCKRGCFTINP
eukprot:4750238-Amphidinium_carterae.1